MAWPTRRRKKAEGAAEVVTEALAEAVAGGRAGGKAGTGRRRGLRRALRSVILGEQAVSTATVIGMPGGAKILRADREAIPAPDGDEPRPWEERAAEALAALRKRGSLPPGVAEIGLSGDSVAYRTYHFPPAGRSDRESLIERSLLQEPAFQQGEIFWDTHSLGVTSSDGIRREAHLVAAARREDLDRALRALHAARIVPRAFLTPELAVFSCFLASPAGVQAKEPILVLHARGRRLTFGVCREGKPLFYRSLDVEDGTEEFGGENSFLLEFRRSLLFFQDQHHGSAISQVVVCGDASRYPPDLEANLEEQFGLRAAFLADPSAREDRVAGGSIAEGLAGEELRELVSLALLPRGARGLAMNLLPHERRERNRRALLAGAMTVTLLAATAAGAFAVSQFDRSLDNRRQAVDTMALDTGRAEQVHADYAEMQAELLSIDAKERVLEGLSSQRMDFSGMLAALANRIPEDLVVARLQLHAGGREDEPTQDPQGVLEGVARAGGDPAANPLEGLLRSLESHPAVADLQLDLGGDGAGTLLAGAGDPFHISFRWRRP